MNSSEKKRPTTRREMSHRAEPAVRELLDHLAKGLAAEYIRLVKGHPDEPASRPARNRKLRRK